MNKEDTRWQQRLTNFDKAFGQLEKAVVLSRTRKLTELEEQGLIQAFEFTHELAWNVMKDFFAYQGNAAIYGSRDAVKEAFNKGLLADGEGWMEMIKSHNQSSHTYDEGVAEEIAQKTINRYYGLFKDFGAKMQTLKTLL